MIDMDRYNKSYSKYNIDYLINYILPNQFEYKYNLNNHELDYHIEGKHYIRDNNYNIIDTVIFNFIISINYEINGNIIIYFYNNNILYNELYFYINYYITNLINNSLKYIIIEL